MFEFDRIKGKFGSKDHLDPFERQSDNTEDQRALAWQAQNREKTNLLIKKAKEDYSGILVPEIDYKTATSGYRILRELEEYDIEFLDNLAVLGVLEKSVHNKFLVCPVHASSFLLSVRVSCPKCSSINIERLNLLEHRACGFISEKKNFLANPEEMKCPSCKKQIKNQEKEIRLPASWYLCNMCKDKFDEAKINLHCNEFDHDFTTTQAGSVALYNYVVSDDSQKSALDIGKLHEEIAKILTKYNHTISENCTVKGKSGIDHNVDIVGTDSGGKTIFVFVNDSDETNMEIDSKLIQILDTSPKIAILVGFSSISEKTKSIAAKYNLSIISSQNLDEIISEVKKIVSAKSKKQDGDNTQ
ncbi:MAG: hypothetical protein EB153_02605 [Nitrosopumilaceae archaeon]|nr:hypothetical protein [Nitrosopumilaceae archaeon]